MGMDTRSGEFVREEEIEKWMETVTVGEIVKMKGEEMRIKEIGRRTLTLELLSHEDRMHEQFSSMTTSFEEHNRHERRRIEKQMRKKRNGK